MKRLNTIIVLFCLASAAGVNHADAQRRGGGGRGGGGSRGGGGGARGGGGFSRGGGGGISRGGARTSVTSRPSRPSGSVNRPTTPVANRPSVGQPGNRPAAGTGGNLGANRPAGGDRTNIGNGNRNNIGNGNNVNVDRPINIQDNDVINGGGHWDHGYGCCSGWGAAAAGFTAGAITAAAIGSTVYALPPACPAYIYGGVTYNHCSGVWYQPEFQGSETTYIVVEAPPGAPPE